MNTVGQNRAGETVTPPSSAPAPLAPLGALVFAAAGGRALDPAAWPSERLAIGCDAAVRHGLAPLAYVATRQMLPAADPLRQWLEGSWRQAIGFEMFVAPRRDALAEALHVAHEVGVLHRPVVALKGAALQRTAYAPFPHARGMADMDLLAHHADLPAVRDILRGQALEPLEGLDAVRGATRSQQHEETWSVPVTHGRFQVDLHSALFPFPLGGSPAALLERATLLPGSPPLWGLATPDMLGHLAAHWVLDQVPLLRNLIDIILYARHIGWVGESGPQEDPFRRETRPAIEAADRVAQRDLGCPLVPGHRTAQSRGFDATRARLIAGCVPVDALAVVPGAAPMRTGLENLGRSLLLQPSAAASCRTLWGRLRRFRWRRLPRRLLPPSGEASR